MCLVTALLRCLGGIDQSTDRYLQVTPLLFKMDLFADEDMPLADIDEDCDEELEQLTENHMYANALANFNVFELGVYDMVDGRDGDTDELMDYEELNANYDPCDNANIQKGEDIEFESDPVNVIPLYEIRNVNDNVWD